SRLRYARASRGTDTRDSGRGWRHSGGLGDQQGVLAQPGRPLRWAAVLIALFAIAASALAYSGYQSQVGRVIDEAQLRAQGAAADVDRYVRERHQALDTSAARTARGAGGT